MSDRIDTSVIIVNWNSGAALEECLAALAPDHRPGREVLVVDNGSTDGSTTRAATTHPWVRFVEVGTNVGFGAGVNRGAAVAAGAILVLLNPDAQPVVGAVTALASALRGNPRAGIVGGGLRHPNGRWQPGAARFGPVAHPWLDTVLGRLSTRHRRRPYEVDWVYGTFMAVRRDLFRQLGGFDERYFLYGEDMDLCWRARALGARVLQVPAAVAIHGDSPSARSRFGGAPGRAAAIVRGELQFFALRCPESLARFRRHLTTKLVLKRAVATLFGARASVAAAREGLIACRTWAP